MRSSKTPERPPDRVQAQVLADLAARVRDALTQEHHRRRHRAAREHHGFAADAELVALLVARGDADGATVLDDDVLGAQIRDDHRALLERARQVRDLDAAASALRAAVVAEALPFAADGVARDGPRAPAERLAAAIDDVGDRADELSLRRRDLQDALDAIEVRRHRGRREVVRVEALAPLVEHPRRRAKARARVDRGRAADELAHQEGDRRAAERERVAEIIRMGVDEAADEVVPFSIRAFFDVDDGVPAIGELAADDRAACARADDDDLALDVAIARPPARALDLLLPAVRLDVLDDLERAAHRLVRPRRVEVGDLEDVRERVERASKDRALLPRLEHARLLAARQRVKRFPLLQTHGLIEERERGAPARDDVRAHRAHHLFEARDRGLVRAGRGRRAGNESPRRTRARREAAREITSAMKARRCNARARERFT